MPTEQEHSPTISEGVVEEVEVRGHIIDSLLLPKILTGFCNSANLRIRISEIGPRRIDPSFARIAVRADSETAIREIVGDLVEHGATAVESADARTVPPTSSGAFPDDFSTPPRTSGRRSGFEGTGSRSSGKRWTWTLPWMTGRGVPGVSR